MIAKIGNFLLSPFVMIIDASTASTIFYYSRLALRHKKSASDIFGFFNGCSLVTWTANQNAVMF